MFHLNQVHGGIAELLSKTQWSSYSIAIYLQKINLLWRFELLYTAVDKQVNQPKKGSYKFFARKEIYFFNGVRKICKMKIRCYSLRLITKTSFKETEILFHFLLNHSPWKNSLKKILIERLI